MEPWPTQSWSECGFVQSQVLRVPRWRAAQAILRGQLEGLFFAPRFMARDEKGEIVGDKEWAGGTNSATTALLNIFSTWGRESALRGNRIVAAGHRVAHGGLKFTQPAQIDSDVLADWESWCHLCRCTSRTTWPQSESSAARAPIATGGMLRHFLSPHTAGRCPGLRAASALRRRGVYRYGFHGLSYEYIASVLPSVDSGAEGTDLVAHLGNGASMLRDEERATASPLRWASAVSKACRWERGAGSTLACCCT